MYSLLSLIAQYFLSAPALQASVENISTLSHRLLILQVKQITQNAHMVKESEPRRLIEMVTIIFVAKAWKKCV